MSLVSVAEAARLVGKSRKTLYGTYIKTGKLSCVLADGGEKKIDTSELLRVFGAFVETKDKTDETAVESVPASHDEIVDRQSETALRLAVLEAENAQLKERLLDKDRHIEDMRQSVRLLEHKQQRASWWPWGRRSKSGADQG